MRSHKATVKWYGEQFKSALQVRLHAAAHQIGAYIVARIVKSMVADPSSPGGPPARITSSYAHSIDYEVGRKKGVLTVRVGSNDKRVLWLELGTGERCERGGSSYVIEPVKAKVLHWKTPDGEDVFTRRVEHPGIHPRPHIRPAVLKSRPYIIRILSYTL